MDNTPFSPFSLEHVPFPALIVREGKTAVCNSAAAELLGLDPAGGPAPEFLSGFSSDSGPTVGTCAANGRTWRFSLSPQGDGLLAVLLPEDPVSSPFPGTAALLEQMRQNIGNLTAAAQLITPALQELGPKYEQYLAIMHQSFYRMLRLMNNAETAGALAEGRLTLSAAPLDLAGLCRELCRKVSGLAEAAGVSFRFDDRCGSLLTTGDSVLIQRMLLCLISNALQAAGSGGRAGLRLTETGGRALLTVWDSGPGLGSRSNAGGAGAGLPIARQIAALHGGALMLESRTGEGLRATVSLPVSRPEQPPLLRTPRQAADLTGGFSPVLIELSAVLPWQVFRQDGLE
ncbi:HAMP domain-containing sensor histidine kinase [Pseudoflavonifractor sp. CLA-AP-H29]|uniref:histidine kinase n=1 Tax=Pseudoflavonifractor intestinihominis TaxID=3133171 RepID=A0ABV1E601_9FIRM